MKIRSLDGSVEVIPPMTGMGFVVVLDGHAWFYDPDGTLCISIPPDPAWKHVAAKAIHECPACRKFLVLD